MRDGHETPLAIGQEASLSARGELDGSMDAPMVFVGYGLSIPEAGWDDFKGLDLKGKIAVYVNAFPPVTVSDNVKSHVNTADERWLALKRAGAHWRRDDSGAAAFDSRPRRSSRGRPRPRHLGRPIGSGRGGRGGGRGRRRAAARSSTLADRAFVDAAGESVAIALTARGAAAVLAGSGHSLDEHRSARHRPASRCRASRSPAR